MKNKYNILAYGLISVLFSSCLVGCKQKSILTIHVLSSEDYIYIEDDGVTTLNTYFEQYYQEIHGVPIKVAYETTDTNETMYNLLKTGKTNYDLMCTSDYIIQKLSNENEIDLIDLDDVPNYRDYASKSISNRLSNAFKLPENAKETETYAVGYMWGTLGILFNPEYDGFSTNVTYEKAINDASSWNMLWDEDYKHTASIKDSMRDTFAVATMKAFDKEVTELRVKLDSGELSPNDYNKELDKIFNFVAEKELDKDKIKLVQDALVSLKKNSFGLEVDSGKQDIVTGKIGINLAWSGDATNAMWEAMDSEGAELLYSLPDNGGNLWLDAWVMPKFDGRSKEVHDAAMEYLDYISTPQNASLNMSYVGYTSFIAGDSVIDYIRDNFDVRVYDVYHVVDEYYYPIFYINDEGEETMFYYDDLDVTDLVSNPELYYYETIEEEHEGLRKIPLNQRYNERNFDYDNAVSDVDLRYFFEGTLDEYDDNDALFYSDENYYVYDEIEEKLSSSVGGIFFCAYPEELVFTRCCIMQDYGDNNKAAIKLWEEFKSDNLPLIATIILIVEAVLIIGGVLYYYISKKARIQLRKARKNR